MNFQLDMQLHLGFGLLVLLALLAVLHPVFHRPSLRPVAVGVYIFAGLVGLAAFFNFGSLHHYTDYGFVNRWEHFHYQLGSKYFPELGYDGLYVASLKAQGESAPKKPTGAFVRDLRSSEMVQLPDSIRHLQEVRERFSPERWDSFVRDHAVYTGNTPRAVWGIIRTDHGYNATPFWTTTARLFNVGLEPTYRSLAILAALDVVLLAIALAFLFATYGYRAACVALAITGLGFGWHYNYIGSFLRLDWWAASLVGVCLLERKRFGLAGVLFAAATFWRIFPVLLLVGPCLHLLKELRQGLRPKWAKQLALGFGVASLLALAAGSLAGRGPQAWLEFVERIGVHTETASSNSVGLTYVVANDPASLLARARAPDKAPQLGRVIPERQPIRALGAVLLLGLTLAVMWRVSLPESAILGLCFIFCLTDPSSYYWILLALVPLARGMAAPLAILAVSCGLFAVELSFDGPQFGALHFGLMSWGLLAVLLLWLWSLYRVGSKTAASEA